MQREDSGTAEGRARAVAKDRHTAPGSSVSTGSRQECCLPCPKACQKNSSAACPDPKACQSKASVTTLMLRMHGGDLGAEVAQPRPHEQYRDRRASARERARQGDAESLLGSFGGC